MSETSETPSVRSAEASEHKTPKVFKAAAWVAIVAGVVFIVSVIFFTGFRLGMHSGSGGYHHCHHGHHAVIVLPETSGSGPAATSTAPPAMRPSAAPAGLGQVSLAVSPPGSTEP